MIILYDESEKEFTTLGLGVLKDVISAKVEEKLNDIFELTIEYPITGDKYSKIKIGRIIAAKPNPYDEIQPFRISSITKPIKGIVTIFCEHISYDANGIPCKAIDALNLNDAINKIQENMIVKNNFKIVTDIQFSRKFKTNAPYNLRALLMGDEKESLIGVYNAELKFNKYSVMLYSKRGKNRGAKVCYGNNMTDLQHESTNERLYNGVFPYYHKETESTETTSENSFTKAYIVGSKPFQDGWLSFSKNGDAYHPVDSTPVQIDTEGEYYEKIYSWNSTYQKYEEKVYNASVSLVEGVTEPSWIYIDWSKFPNLVCKANKKGYFKTMTETDWGEIKGVGDIIFEGNVLTGGLTNMTDNMVIYYSEVLPPNHSASSETTVTSVDVILDDPVIHVDTSDAKTMKYDKILSLDLTSQFEEEPTKEKLKAKAEEYIVKNLVGTIKHTTTVSFIDLASTTDRYRYQNFDHIELGDTVKVIYKDLGVDVDLRVISTEYDALKGTYTNIELGEKKDNFSSQTIQNGDNISSLSNDVGYADITTVNKLIADTVTADYLQAVNATMSKAQIEYLQVAKISCPGILEASQLVLDELVAKMLIADNAKIAETLEAGTIKVAGDISITSGSINITDDGSTSFIVDREGNVTANSVAITGGTFDINEGTFEVTNDGTMTAKNAYIEGEIIATSGEIGGCTIDEDGNLIVPSANVTGTFTADDIVGGTLSGLEIKIGPISGTNPKKYNFEVDTNGNAKARSMEITGGTIRMTDNSETIFEVTSEGNVTASSINITGGSIGIYDPSTGANFGVDADGHFEANDVDISGGVIGNLTITDKLYFSSAPIANAYIRINSMKFLHYVTVQADELTRGVDYLECTLPFTLVGYNWRQSLVGLALDDFYWEDFSVVLDDPREFILEGQMEELGEDGYTLYLAYDDYPYDHSNIYPNSAGPTASERFSSIALVIIDDYIRDLTSYTSEWLSEAQPTGGTDGPAITPSSSMIYAVYNPVDNSFVGYYQWSLVTRKYTEVDILYYIDSSGLKLPNISSDIISGTTKIAGFDIDPNTITSVTDTTEVGMSSGTYNYAFWAGKEEDNDHPFSVTHTGELHSTKGKIGSFYINDMLSTNEYKTIDNNEEGLYLNSDGIGFYDSKTRNKIVITANYGILSTCLQADPAKKNRQYLSEYNGTFPLLITWPAYPRDEVTSSGDFSMAGIEYESDEQFFTFILPDDDPFIAIGLNTTRKIILPTQNPTTQELSDLVTLRIKNVIATPIFTDNASNGSSDYEIGWKNPEYGSSTPGEIYIKNKSTTKILRLKLLVIVSMNVD